LLGICGAAVLMLAGCSTPKSAFEDLPADGTRPLVPPEPTDSKPCMLDVVADLPVHEDHGRLMTRANINGQPANMIFDTGSDVTLLTPDGAKRLGLSKQNAYASTLSGIGGSRKAIPFQADAIRVGVLHGDDWGLEVADIRLGELGAKPDGLLGAELFRRYDIDLDLAGGDVRIFYAEHDCSAPSAYLTGPLHMVPLESTIRPGVPISLDMLSYITVHVKIGGQSLVALIDSGSMENLVFASGAAKLKWTQGDAGVGKERMSGGIGPAVVRGRERVISALSIGDVRLENVPVTATEMAIAPSGADMILGLPFLQRVHVWVSHSSAHVILQAPPAPSPELPPLPDAARG
jgi:predicted aspartyl protease